jgi:hypothetical protein
MFRLTFAAAGGLAVTVAAAIATVFTFATATPFVDEFHIRGPRLEIMPIYDVNRTIKGDRFPMHLKFPQVTIPETNDNTIVNQNPMERTFNRNSSPGQNAPRTQGCELDLNPDISTNTARCIAFV